MSDDLWLDSEWAEETSPSEGGCWYCHLTGGEMVFSTEFDCYLHMKCLHDALNRDQNDPEARIMMRELG